ncbi:MAG: hypothetical protein ACE5HD_03715 [Acidobacteriota bacterium]
MSRSAWIAMGTILVLVWGGFAAAVGLAISYERRKHENRAPRTCPPGPPVPGKGS